MEKRKKKYACYEEMYLSEYPLIYQYICRMVRDDEDAACDLTQDVFGIAFLKWESIRDYENISGYLINVAKNKLKKWYVEEKPIYLEAQEAMDVLSTQKAEDGHYGMIELCSSVEHILSGGDLSILRHYYEYGYTASELAEQLGISEDCFKQRVSRMKEKIRGSLVK